MFVLRWTQQENDFGDSPDNDMRVQICLNLGFKLLPRVTALGLLYSVAVFATDDLLCRSLPRLPTSSNK